MAGLQPVVVSTGATGAIGSATAALLARRGARLLLLSRLSDNLEAMVTRLDTDNRVTSVEVDLSSFASVRAAARQISREVAHVDALINTAAVFTSEYEQSDDGIELMLATNHFGPFLLTNLLRDNMTGWFFKGGHRIDPPKSTLDVDAQSNLWKRSVEIVELGETGF